MCVCACVGYFWKAPEIVVTMIGFVGSLGVGKGLFVGRRNVEGCRVVRREGRAVFSRRVRMCEGGSDGSASKTVEKVGGRGTLQILQDPSGDTFYLKDEKTKEKRELTLREKESLFLDALYSYGSNEDLVLTDDQFDLLKEDLTWEGSHVMLLNDQEKKFLEAARAYHKGKPLMSDEEFDSMRDILRLAGSPVAVSKGPKCSLETMVCATDCTPDNGRMFITQLPAAGIGALIWAAITYEVTPLRNIPHIYTLIGGIPLIALIGKVSLITFHFPLKITCFER